MAWGLGSAAKRSADREATGSANSAGMRKCSLNVAKRAFVMILTICSNYVYAAEKKQSAISPAILAAEANTLILAGEDKAIMELTTNVRITRNRLEFFCTILWIESTDRASHQSITVGTPANLPASFDSRHWPDFPYTLSGLTYFSLVSEYSFYGVVKPFSIVEYIAKCREHAKFRKALLPVPTRAQARRDVIVLWSSTNYKNMWNTPHDEFERYMFGKLEAITRKYLSDQVDAVK